MTPPSLRIGVVGATGLIGRTLCERLAARGDRPVVFSRDPAKVRRVIPQADDARPNDALAHGGLDDLDAVVNLAGEPVMGQRWDPAFKARIRDSRVRTTRAVVDGIAHAKGRVKTLVNASAVGFYGPRGDERVGEDAAPGGDFLAGVCVDWEREAQRAAEHGAREVRLRIGIVLGDGGALTQMVTPFKLFAGGHVGSGQQYMPWVHLDDVVGAALFALDTPTLRGPVNVTAPEPLRASAFARVLGSVLRRPAWLPVPTFALRVAVGEVAEVVTTGQNATPDALRAAGYTFRHPDLAAALRDALGPHPASAA
ncbi:MAG: TIGR01777 family oxidoreductase [Polyangiales bacterium]